MSVRPRDISLSGQVLVPVGLLPAHSGDVNGIFQPDVNGRSGDWHSDGSATEANDSKHASLANLTALPGEVFV